MKRRTVLALDFDGVICDSTQECVVTAWNAWKQANIRSPLEVPEPYRSSLTAQRNYVRSGGEYLVVLDAAEKGLSIRCQADYDQLLGQIRPSLAGFAERFFRARDAFRSDSEADWINLHQIYTGIADGLHALWPVFNIVVVTGKDRESVKLFFNRMELPLADDRIYDKNAAFDKLQAVRAAGAAVLIDDNIHHLRPVHEAGFGALMAGWGYHTNEHLQLAEQLGVPVIQLDNWVNVVLSGFGLGVSV